MRTVPHILRRNTGPYAAQYTGIAVRRLPTAFVDKVAPIVGRLQTPDLSAQGLPRPDTGLLTRVERDNAIPVQDVGIIDAIRSGAVEPVAALREFDGDGVVLADGSRLTPDVVVLATGYSQGLEPLIGHLGVLDEKGRPVERGGRTARGAKGLWFTGYTNPISGMLREPVDRRAQDRPRHGATQAPRDQGPPQGRLTRHTPDRTLRSVRDGGVLRDGAGRRG